MQFHIGTSGWQYRDWNGVFYPESVKSADQLKYYATKFDTVEINSTFYHVPRISTCEKWREQTPDNFVFTLKLYRGITHLKRLVIDETSRQQLADFCESAAVLGPKLGMILVQLPPSLKKDIILLTKFFEAIQAQSQRLHTKLPLTLEVRSASWFDNEVMALLDAYNVGWVINDSPNRWPSAQYVTGDRLYIRFHGNRELYRSSYTDAELRDWAKFITAQNVRDAWIYFNNDYDGVGPENALRLINLLSTSRPDTNQSV